MKELKGVDKELATCSNDMPKFLLKKATNHTVSGMSIMELILEYFQCLVPVDIQMTKNKSVRKVSRNEKTTAAHPLIVTDFKSYP